MMMLETIEWFASIVGGFIALMLYPSRFLFDQGLIKSAS